MSQYYADSTPVGKMIHIRNRRAAPGHNCIAEVYDPDLAERIIKMLVDEGRYYKPLSMD